MTERAEKLREAVKDAAWVPVSGMFNVNEIARDIVAAIVTESGAKNARFLLVTARADMATIHKGLVEADMLPSLRDKIGQWIVATNDAADALATLEAAQ